VKAATRESDLVVVGHITRNISTLTPNDAFVITDSEFVVEETWKSNSQPDAAADNNAGAEITIVTIGGVVKSDGHVISAHMPNREVLKIGDHYLLFLHYIPTSRSYSTVGFEGFEIHPDRAKGVHKFGHMPGESLATNPTVFMQSMRASVMRAISEGGK